MNITFLTFNLLSLFNQAYFYFPDRESIDFVKKNDIDSLTNLHVFRSQGSEKVVSRKFFYDSVILARLDYNKSSFNNNNIWTNKKSFLFNEQISAILKCVHLFFTEFVVFEYATYSLNIFWAERRAAFSCSVMLRHLLTSRIFTSVIPVVKKIFIIKNIFLSFKKILSSECQAKSYLGRTLNTSAIFQ